MDSQTHYDYEDGTVATTVLRPFMTAGREFQWGDGCVPGIGIDKYIFYILYFIFYIFCIS